MDLRSSNDSGTERLKADANAWYAALRADDPNAWVRLRRTIPDAAEPVTLREVRRALAIEHGYPGWIPMLQRLLRERAAASETRAHYEEKADALLAAYRT
ncbi:MAG: hypothetical protein IT353_24255, partial [Gemmatimonadaceae bacterium]|nr:hypothetical protein [Gemmatimonadaceae bacterium]